MANLRIVVKEDKSTGKAAITFYLPIEFSESGISELKKSIFEIEMYNAEIIEENTTVVVKMVTTDQEKIIKLQKGMWSSFKQKTGIDKINDN